MITEQEMMKLKHGDKVLVECTVEAVFVKSGMVMVTTRDCDKGFDAYEDEVIAVMPDKVTNGDVIKALFPDCEFEDNSLNSERFDNTTSYLKFKGNMFTMAVEDTWWNAPYKGRESEEE